MFKGGKPRIAGGMLTRAHATDFDEDKDIAHVPGMYVLVLRSLTLSVPVRSGISFSRNIGDLAGPEHLNA